MAIRQANAVDTTKTAEATVAAAAVEPTAEAGASTQQVEVETVVDEALVADPVVETTADQAAEEPAATREEASAAVLDEEPAPAAEAAATNAQAPQAETGTSIQPAAAGNTAVAVHGRSSFFQQILADLAEEGFEGIELDYSSFLNVTLNKQIETSEGGELPNAGFKVRLASARKKYCFRNNNPVEDEVEVAYSYDLNAPNDPESVVAQKIKEADQKLPEGVEAVRSLVAELKKLIDYYRDVLADALDLARRKVRILKPGEDPQVVARKLFAYLARRGFDAEICRAAVSRFAGNLGDLGEF